MRNWSYQTPFTVQFSPFLGGSLQLERWAPCVTPPDNEPSNLDWLWQPPPGQSTDWQPRCLLYGRCGTSTTCQPLHTYPAEEHKFRGKYDSVWILPEKLWKHWQFQKHRGAFGVCSVHAWWLEFVCTSKTRMFTGLLMDVQHYKPQRE